MTHRNWASDKSRNHPAIRHLNAGSLAGGLPGNQPTRPAPVAGTVDISQSRFRRSSICTETAAPQCTNNSVSRNPYKLLLPITDPVRPPNGWRSALNFAVTY